MAKKATKTIDTSEYEYGTIKVRGKDGKIRHSVGNGDAVARAMIGMEFDDLVKVMHANKLDEKLGKLAKNAVNNGLFRMSLGGSLRALVRNGTPAKIGKHVVKSLKQHVPVEEAKVEPRKPKPAKKAKAAKPKKVKAARKPRAPKMAPAEAVHPAGAEAQ